MNRLITSPSSRIVLAIFEVKAWRHLAWLFFGWLWVLGAFAAPEAVKQWFDLPTDTADRSIKRFSEQSGLEVFYPSSATRGLRTQPVKGEMTAREALDAMLVGTGLTVVQDERTGAISLKKRKSDPNG